MWQLEYLLAVKTGLFLCQIWTTQQPNKEDCKLLVNGRECQKLGNKEKEASCPVFQIPNVRRPFARMPFCRIKNSRNPFEQMSNDQEPSGTMNECQMDECQDYWSLLRKNFPLNVLLNWMTVLKCKIVIKLFGQMVFGLSTLAEFVNRHIRPNDTRLNSFRIIGVRPNGASVKWILAFGQTVFNIRPNSFRYSGQRCLALCHLNEWNPVFCHTDQRHSEKWPKSKFCLPDDLPSQDSLSNSEKFAKIR